MPLRLFFALWPEADTRERIAGAAAALRLGDAARLVPHQNYHLTLAFVGEVTKTQVEVLRQIGRRQRAAGCTIRIDAYEYWPDSQVVAAVAQEPPTAMAELWMHLHQDLALDPAVPKRNRRQPPLRAHVTLARKVAQAPVLPAMSPFAWSVRSFCLVRSDTGAAHSIYTVVDTWPLLDELPKP
jgi:2'-5' RNA ligase